MTDIYLELLRSMISIPSYSGEEDGTAALIYDFLDSHGAAPSRVGNNIYALSEEFNSSLPTLLLTSHHDTSRPQITCRRSPFSPDIVDGRLYGLGSVEAGASVAALIAAFMELRTKPMPFNLMLAITAEGETAGEGGMNRFLRVLSRLGIHPAAAIIGAPTSLRGAVAEHGKLLLAAETKGSNAIYRAMDDIAAVRAFRLPEVSQLMGPVAIDIRGIKSDDIAGRQPELCCWNVELSTTDAYPNAEVLELLRKAISRNTMLKPCGRSVDAAVIRPTHPLVKAFAGQTFVSHSPSAMTLLPFPSIKIGPGNPARARRPDEFVEISEIKEAISLYVNMMTVLRL